MSKDNFDRLVNQFSAEAEADRAAEERSRQQSVRMKKIANMFFWVLVCGVAATSYFYRNEITQAAQSFTGGKQAPADEQQVLVDGKPVKLGGPLLGADAPSKFANLQRLTQKHAAEVDSSGNLDTRQAEVPSKTVAAK